MEYLTVEDILSVHSVVINETGGAHGVREPGNLAALEALPQQQAFGTELYPTLYLKAAVYIRNIIFGHPFIDGNKRSSMATADLFLQLNGRKIAVQKGGVEAFALLVVKNKLSLEEIATWLEKQTKSL